jgi:type IV secretory pathway TraG/TraD family ATPase VirD4
MISHIPYRRIFTSKEARWGWALLLSFFPWLFSPWLLRFFRKTAASIKEDSHIRGARLITEAQIKKETDGSGILKLGTITIPEILSRRHLLIAGQTGSGKSTLLIQHLGAIQRAGRRAVVNDFKGELVERFYRAGRDLILNPLDARGVGWTLFNELQSKPDLTAITGSLIPQARGEDRFWSQAAQDVLRAVMAYCYQFDQRSNAQLWQAITSPIKYVADMCQATDSGRAGYSYIQDAGSKQASSVIAVLMSYVSWLEFATDGYFSLKAWAENLSGSTIFITNTEEASNIMRPYLSLFADLAGKRFLSLAENSESHKNIYLMLDEMGNMQRLPTVKRLLTAGRSKGIIVEIGIADFASIESIYGREDAHTIINSCGSKFILNLGDPVAAKLFSDLGGEEDFWEGSTTYSISQDDQKGGETYGRQIRTRKVIMPAEIMRLPVGGGYFMLPGGNPALIKIPWREANQRPKINPAFILRPGLSLNKLEQRDYEISTQAQNIGEAPLFEELENQG